MWVGGPSLQEFALVPFKEMAFNLLVAIKFNSETKLWVHTVSYTPPAQ